MGGKLIGMKNGLNVIWSKFAMGQTWIKRSNFGIANGGDGAVAACCDAFEIETKVRKEMHFLRLRTTKSHIVKLDFTKEKKLKEIAVS